MFFTMKASITIICRLKFLELWPLIQLQKHCTHGVRLITSNEFFQWINLKLNEGVNCHKSSDKLDNQFIFFCQLFLSYGPLEI